MRWNRVGVVIIFVLSVGGVFVRGPSAFAASLPVPSPVVFVANHGQYAEPVKCVLRGSRGTVFFTPTEVVFSFVREDPETNLPMATPARDGAGIGNDQPLVSRLVFRYRFEGANEHPDIVGDKELPGKINILGGPRKNRTTGIPAYEEIVYRNLYDGMDLRFRFDHALQLSVLLHEDANPGSIRLAYTGIDELDLDASGNLIVSTPFGDFHEPPPTFSRVTANGTVPVKVGFRFADTNTISFSMETHNLGMGVKQ